MLPQALHPEQSSGQALLDLVILEESLHLFQLTILYHMDLVTLWESLHFSQLTILYQTGMCHCMAHVRNLQCFLLPCGTSAFVMAFGEQKAAPPPVSEGRGTLGTSQTEQEPQQLLSELEKIICMGCRS